MSEWTVCKLGDIVEITMGQSPPGTDCNSSGIGTPLLNGPTEFGSHHPLPVQYTTNSKKNAQRGDILFCVRGSTTGRMNWADQEYSIGRGLAAIRHLDGSEFNHFVKGVIEYHLPTLLASATGSTFPNVSREQLSNLSISCPPPATQRAIAEILSSLDDKIELNNQINQNLEALAQAIFKRWFVDFEFPDENGQPYKSSGGEMVESELGEIPKGWRVVPIGDLFESVIGGDWGKEKIDSDHTEMCAVVRGTDIPTIRNSAKEGIPLRAIKHSKMKDRLLAPGDIVIEISGGSKDQATGRSLLITKEILERINHPAIPASFCRKIRPKKGLSELVAVHLSQIYQEGKMFAYQNQSTGISNFQFKYFSQAELLALPNEATDLIKSFTHFAKDIFAQMTSNENVFLAGLRDQLLPKLITGELKIDDVPTKQEITIK